MVLDPHGMYTLGVRSQLITSSLLWFGGKRQGIYELYRNVKKGLGDKVLPGIRCSSRTL